MQIELNDIGHIIQLSVAPVFLLTGVGTTLTVLTNRLARIVDRSRILEDRVRKEDDAHTSDYRDELITLYSRSHLINRAIVLATACALMISLVIISLFVGDALNIDLSKYIAAFFVLAMVSLLVSFSYLLREIFLATQTMRTVVRLPK
ncbi:MAG TPA: DUF2721 domain-containing protein [Oxalicibacterium sp.]